ncbi:hypothetical protein SRHO_G00334710 [Serrasalmus rhombeus]
MTSEGAYARNPTHLRQESRTFFLFLVIALDGHTHKLFFATDEADCTSHPARLKAFHRLDLSELSEGQNGAVQLSGFCFQTFGALGVRGVHNKHSLSWEEAEQGFTHCQEN